MSAIGEVIAREARDWIGTPFQWQGRLKQVGCDCKGLVAGVAKSCGRAEADSVEALAGDYDGVVQIARLTAGLRNLFDRSDAPMPGDVLLLWDHGRPQHLAICTSTAPLRAVQAFHTGPKCVVEVGVPRASLHSVWRWRTDDLVIADREAA